jgi:hypothetical protein
MAETIKIGGELESMATGKVVAAASAIKDKAKDEYQDAINARVDTALADRYTKSETYNKSEVEQMVTPPSPDYKVYDTYADMLAETDHPAGAIYRVSSWDGNANDGAGAVDATKYSEYSWTGSEYKLLSVKA